MGMTADALDALAAQAEDSSRLGFGGNLDGGGAIQRRDFDLATQCCRGERDRHFAMQVVVVALEDIVRLEVDLDIQIARRAAIDAMLALAGQANAIALIDPGWNLDRQRLVLLEAAGAVAILQGSG
jgi:hypothetical protein